jgi:hypothetical protein
MTEDSIAAVTTATPIRMVWKVTEQLSCGQIRKLVAIFRLPKEFESLVVQVEAAAEICRVGSDPIRMSRAASFWSKDLRGATIDQTDR